jgi:hypothetical protein
MQKVFMLILMLAFMGYAPQAFGAKHHKKVLKAANYVKRSKKIEGIIEQISLLRYEIEALDNGTSKDNLYRLNKWVCKLEAKVLSKLQHAEVRLEKYKSKKSATAEINEETEVNAEKIRSSESKIQVCKELLTVLDQLKSKLNKY